MTVKRYMTFRYITVQRLIDELRGEGFMITRPVFYRLEKRLPFPIKKSSGGWRRYNRKTADLIKNMIKEDYGEDTSYVIPDVQYPA